ncbi:hypothetical protein [Dyella sp.]|uniref:hypothetical protein n=1 Tax=Dyella sp. TaxID=1869338 RepID=UPI002B45C356|nr:hypothetical protein [Dyella sp.]HKT30785.1 hypothetical protein [Dyella sp.]
MNCIRTITLLALCVAISACDSPDTTLASGGITLKDNIVTLHVDGTPDAQIDANGALVIGDKAVTVTPSQHGLLMLYFQNVSDVHQTGLAMGKIGAGMGMKAINDSLDGKSKSEKDKDAEAGGQRLKTLGIKMCQDQANITDIQDQLGAQLPAFKPYAKIATKHLSDCDKD